MIETRQIGKNGPWSSAIGLGCWGMSGTYGASDEATAIATIRHALDIGVTHIDTADTYGEGHNEGLVGRALAGRRQQAFLASKFGRVNGPGGQRGVDGRPAYVRSACDASLQRLGVETIDLYYYHRIDPTVPLEETVGAMAELVRAGKVRYLGVSEANPEQIRRAAAVHPIAAIQNEYSLFTRDIEDNGILATARALGIAVVAYSPLGRGFFGGAVRSLDGLAPDDGRRRVPRYQGENLTHNLVYLERIDALAAELQITTAQLALAWLLAQGPDIIPIPGTKQSTYLDQNAAATDVLLGPGERARIEAAVPKGAAAGARSGDPLTPL